MSPELIAILAVGVALAGIVVTGQRAARAEINTLRTDLDKGLAGLREEIGSLRERMARLEGLLEGLREAISGRRDAA